MGPTDWNFYVVGAFPKNPTLGCNEPLEGSQTDTLLDGRPAKLFVRQGLQADPNQWVIDVIAERNGTCTWLQEVTGDQISRDEATATFTTIQATFRFGA